MPHRIKVTPSWVCEFHTFDSCIDRRYRLPQHHFTDGYLSEKAARNLRLRVNYMLYIAKKKSLRKSINLPVTNYKLVFITLTLSSTQLHSDVVIKQKLLQPFLRIMRGKWKCKNYLWKAESQDNGNIHFHITTDRYIHWEEIRTTWNTIQETMGYISRSTSTNPNSTDVHAVYKCNNPGAYLSKYLNKKDVYKKEISQVGEASHYYHTLNNITACDCKTRKEVGIKRGIEGKIYDCNSELKKINPVWDMNYAASCDVEDRRNEGGKKIDEAMYRLTFFDSITEKKYPALHLILNHFIEVAYISKNS